MALNDLIQKFEAAKRRVKPIIEKNRLVLPIFRIEKDGTKHFRGDGLFYTCDDKLAWKYGQTGHDATATPEHLLEAYKHFKQVDIKMEEALIDTITRLDEWYRGFNDSINPKLI